MPLHAVVTPESAGSRGHYNIQAVARRTGVPAPTIRAWERRYGLPSPQRTPGRQRLYSDDDVHFIAWMRKRTGEGVSAGRAADLWRDTMSHDQAAAPVASAQPPLALSQAFVQAILRHDTSRAESVLGQAFALYDLETVCTRV